MNGSNDRFEELGQLIALLCEGELDAGQAPRLEELAGRSVEARHFFLQYLLLEGELYWDQAAAASRRALTAGQPAAETLRCSLDPSRPAAVAAAGRAAPPRKIPLALWAVAAAALVVIAAWSSRPGPGDRPPAAASDDVARLTGSLDAEWAGQPPSADHEPLAAGTTLRLRRGLAEITFSSGARVILQGAAVFRLATAGSGELDSGRLAATVPGEAAGFAVYTPSAVIVDRGTEFGVVAEQNGPSEIHVFAGVVEVETVDTAGTSGPRRRLRTGHAVRVRSAAAGSQASMVEIALAERAFVRRLSDVAPPAGSVARFRSLVAGEPNLIHHYTFEGTTRQQQCRDRLGDLNLADVVMADGRGGGNVEFSAKGFDATTKAVRPFRAAAEGNSNGVALQSETPFHPPPELTVELLLSFDGLARHQPAEIAAAVATRDERSCGFFVAAVADGQLVYLMDPDAPWGQSDLVFEAGQWYYVAATFHAEPGHTRVNVYAANLEHNERVLRRVVTDQVVPGVPAASRLGIGKAFDRSTAHAYPWAGALDEVALYDAVLDPQTLGRHLEALLGAPPPVKTANR